MKYTDHFHPMEARGNEPYYRDLRLPQWLKVLLFWVAAVPLILAFATGVGIAAYGVAFALGNPNGLALGIADIASMATSSVLFLWALVIRTGPLEATE